MLVSDHKQQVLFAYGVLPLAKGVLGLLFQENYIFKVFLGRKWNGDFQIPPKIGSNFCVDEHKIFDLQKRAGRGAKGARAP